MLTQPANGSVVVNSNGTFTITRNLTTITQLTFTYRLMDNGPDNDINTTADNMFDDATVTVNWPVGGALPVSLVHFSGSRNGSYVNLQWTTNSESNSYRDDNMAIGGLRTGLYMLIITNKTTSEKLAHKLVVL